jgi:hypothetical protein
MHLSQSLLICRQEELADCRQHDGCDKRCHVGRCLSYFGTRTTSSRMHEPGCKSDHFVEHSLVTARSSICAPDPT